MLGCSAARTNNLSKGACFYVLHNNLLVPSVCLFYALNKTSCRAYMLIVHLNVLLISFFCFFSLNNYAGVFYLYMKTAERAHLPNKLWERVKLPRNYEKAMDVINKHLVCISSQCMLPTHIIYCPQSHYLASFLVKEFWPKLLVHKIKQRLTKMTQYRIRMRKLQLKVRQEFLF